MRGCVIELLFWDKLGNKKEVFENKKEPFINIKHTVVNCNNTWAGKYKIWKYTFSTMIINDMMVLALF